MSFSKVEWTEDDIYNALERYGIENPSEDLIDKVLDYPGFEDTLTERMIEMGWSVIEDVIEEVISQEQSLEQ